MNKLFEIINKEKLTSKEKERGLLDLKKFMSDSHYSKIKSPYYDSIFVFARRHSYIISSTLILILLISTGTSVASGNSLPGDILYPIKLLNEKVEILTTFGKVPQVEIEAKHLLTRLDETEQLTTLGRLNDSLSTQINNQLELQTQKTFRELESLKTNGLIIDAAKIGSSLESSLSDHEESINRLSFSTSTKPEIKNNLSELASNIKGKIKEASIINGDLEDSIATSSNKDSAKMYAKEILKSTQQKITLLEKHVNEFNDLVSATSSKKIRNNIDEAKNTIGRSQKKIEDGSLKDAFRLLRQVNQTTRNVAEIHDNDNDQNMSSDDSISDTNEQDELNTQQTSSSSNSQINNAKEIENIHESDKTEIGD